MNATRSLTDGAALWHGNLSVTSVDLLAMIVSDAGLSSADPEWCNASPRGCFLIGLQPRGGWQVMQRAVQWGDDRWAHCFGIKPSLSNVYQYFACTIRNRLEVWDSDRFICPSMGTQNAPGKKHCRRHRGILRQWFANFKQLLAGDQGEEHSPWLREFPVEGRGKFRVNRPTKLIDGSRGGQAFMCKFLLPETGQAYGVEEQARMQFLSVLLVATGLMPTNGKIGGPALVSRQVEMLREDFEMGDRLGSVFRRLQLGLLIGDVMLIAFIVVVFYSVWGHNYFGYFAPYAVQLASLSSWAIGAIGLLAMGGNPRVKLSFGVENIPQHILGRLYDIPHGSVRKHETGVSAAEKAKMAATLKLDMRKWPKKADADGNVTLEFGFFQGAMYQEGQGSCTISFEELENICGLQLELVRTWRWKAAMVWYISHLLASILLQLVAPLVATWGSQVLGLIFLLATSILRGIGISGPEEWMIPRWAMREGAHYAVSMQGKVWSRK